jgi:HAD superfamily hydrolase (TIGR01509 family)
MEHLRPIDNALELIGFLKKAGFRLALATSSYTEYAQLVLEKLGIDSVFDKMVTGNDVSKGKPDPEIFLKAAEQLGVLPEECMVIEDSGFGVQAAKKAGMFCFGFRSPNSMNQDLSMADRIVDDIGEVRAYFSGETQMQ